MGNSLSSIQKINFEDIQYTMKNPESYLLINTLNDSEQDCLIPNTIPASNEERIVNETIKNGAKNRRIVIIYGKNANDEKIYTKYNQLQSLGFYQVYIYTGGMFEWLLLQDVYGSQEFPTTKKELDLLKFKPNKVLNVTLLEY
jgi:3-mercaptopyruvate sulfurtransferase SseA